MRTGVHRRTALGVAVLFSSFLLAGCSDAGGMTCSEFNAQDIGKQTDTLGDLLREHDLDTTDPGNIQGVTSAVSSLCASDSSATLDQATDWDSGTW